MKKATRKVSAQKNARKSRAAPRGRPFKPGNPWRIKPGEVRNPGGRPRLLSDAYREWLAAENEQGVTNAANVAVTIGTRAMIGDVQSAKELRQATEGDKFTFDLNKLTDEQLSRIAAGEDPRVVLAASGTSAATATTAENTSSKSDADKPTSA